MGEASRGRRGAAEGVSILRRDRQGPDSVGGGRAQLKNVKLSYVRAYSEGALALDEAGSDHLDELEQTEEEGEVEGNPSKKERRVQEVMTQDTRL